LRRSYLHSLFKIWTLVREFVFSLDAVNEKISAVAIALESGVKYASLLACNQDLSMKVGLHRGLSFVAADLAVKGVAVGQTIPGV